MKLDQIIPQESTRKIVYIVFGAIGLALGVAQTIVASLEQSQPAWLTAAFAVYAYLAAAGFSVSTANTSSQPEPEVSTNADDFEEVPLGKESSVTDVDFETADFGGQVVATAGSEPGKHR